MTELLERPALHDLVHLCDVHGHTAHCWWNARLAAWVCPPPQGGRT